MRKTLCAVLCALTLFLPTAAAAEEPLFFDESEAQAAERADNAMHPVVWVFVGIGAVSLGVCGWFVFVNRERNAK